MLSIKAKMCICLALSFCKYRGKSPKKLKNYCVAKTPLKQVLIIRHMHFFLISQTVMFWQTLNFISVFFSHDFEHIWHPDTSNLYSILDRHKHDVDQPSCNNLYHQSCENCFLHCLVSVCAHTYGHQYICSSVQWKCNGSII